MRLEPRNIVYTLLYIVITFCSMQLHHRLE